MTGTYVNREYGFRLVKAGNLSKAAETAMALYLRARAVGQRDDSLRARS
jgi:hypothetical protein